MKQIEMLLNYLKRNSELVKSKINRKNDKQKKKKVDWNW